MNWSSIETGLISAVRSAADDPSLTVFWQETPQGFRTFPLVRLDVVSFDNVGRDEIRGEADAGTQTIQQRVYGNRLLTIQITIETRSQSLAGSAMALADTVRTGLGGEAVRDALASGPEVGLTLRGPVRHATYTNANGMRQSFASFEVTLNAHSSQAMREIEYIAEVRYSGDAGDVSVSGTATLP